MLFAMAVDERQNMRESGYSRMLKARNQNQRLKTVITFKTLSTNFHSADYSELVDWTKCRLSSPPMMEGLIREFIASVLQNKSLPGFDFLNSPCQTQIVERCLKLVTESAERVYGQRSKDGCIQETLFSNLQCRNLIINRNLTQRPWLNHHNLRNSNWLDGWVRVELELSSGSFHKRNNYKMKEELQNDVLLSK
ncbi:hypothetical protein AVEN_185051-1 [Araneus ventricosus]|uniref:Uncharacterized protein n=1 Tax=Araneus ventricosus TaxID=182803 RepID=A0A4Y2BQ69_ARAVE|nr:hypothetical protein AVEN_185051-1 [Araneus ventricosus]